MMFSAVELLLDIFGVTEGNESDGMTDFRKILLESYRKSVFDCDWYGHSYITAHLSPELEKIAILDYIQRSSPTSFVNPTIWFDERFYRETYPDVALHIHEGKFISGYHHYIRHGMRENRSPNEYFDEKKYMEDHPDVKSAFDRGELPCAYFHYLTKGRSEGRLVTKFRVGKGNSGKPALDRHRITEFHIASGLESNGKSFGFTSTTRDPQFWIDAKIPAGFFRIRIEMKYWDIHASTALLQLFWTDDAGVREENSLKFPIKNNSFFLDTVLYASGNVHGIRFDPIDARGSFTIDYFSIMGLGEKEGRAETVELLLSEPPPRRSHLLAKLDRREDFIWSDLCNALSGAVPKDAGDYQYWIQQRAIDSAAREYLVTKIALFSGKPLISVLMPTYKANIPLLALAIKSVTEQIYENWELIIVDDGSCDKAISSFLNDYRGHDKIRIAIRSKNAGISAATNIALGLAKGEFIALLDHDDMLAPHALFALAREIDQDPLVDMIYSDEDKISETGLRYGPFFKPDWSPEFMLSCMYTCHLSAYRRKIVEDVGGFRSEFDFAQDYDLAFRISRIARKIVHVPDVLYHWRATEASTASGADAKPVAEIAARRAVQAALDAAGVPGSAVEGPLRGTHRVKLDIKNQRLVSIVIPTAARRIEKSVERWYLLDLLRSIREKSTYTNYEIILVHNGDIEEKLKIELKSFNPRYVQYRAKIFNISDKINLGVSRAKGSHIVLLNDDMTVISPSWIEELLMWFSFPGVEGVGAKLLFPNDTIQHAGVLLLAQGPSHPYYGSDASETGLAGSAMVARNYSAVTGACLMVRTETFKAVGGFDPFFRVNYNDVDFCLKIGRIGRIVYTPYALLYHYESVSKDEPPAEELEQFNRRWSDIVGHDPAYNRNQSQCSSLGEIGYPPRTLYEDY